MKALALLLLALLAACAGRDVRAEVGDLSSPELEVATFGAGCFWCSEAALEQLGGVIEVTAGFMGGAPLEDADADALIAAGHAEVARVVFDPARLSYEELLQWFWRIHDPTSVDKQGADEGPEYRSVIFVHDAGQRAAAEASRAERQAATSAPIVTSIEDATRFYPAAERHQDYYARNRDGEYCRTVIAPHLRSVGLDD